MNTWDKRLAIGKTDNYSVTVDNLWLSGDTITSAVVTSTSDPDDVIIGVETILTGSQISVPITGVTSGYHPVHFEYTTQAGRSDCVEVFVYVAGTCGN